MSQPPVRSLTVKRKRAGPKTPANEAVGARDGVTEEALPGRGPRRARPACGRLAGRSDAGGRAGRSKDCAEG